jgi:hypothetical protein
LAISYLERFFLSCNTRIVRATIISEQRLGHAVRRPASGHLYGSHLYRRSFCPSCDRKNAQEEARDGLRNRALRRRRSHLHDHAQPSEKLNAWTRQMHLDLKDACTRPAPTRRAAIILTGAGRGFCAGADMGGLQAIGAAAAPPIAHQGAADLPAAARWPSSA